MLSKSFLTSLSPVNFLNPRHRLVYVLACGALASQWFGLLTVSSYSTNDVNKWATPIVNCKYNN